MAKKKGKNPSLFNFFEKCIFKKQRIFSYRSELYYKYITLDISHHPMKQRLSYNMQQI